MVLKIATDWYKNGYPQSQIIQFDSSTSFEKNSTKNFSGMNFKPTTATQYRYERDDPRRGELRRDELRRGDPQRGDSNRSLPVEGMHSSSQTEVGRKQVHRISNPIHHGDSMPSHRAGYGRSAGVDHRDLHSSDSTVSREHRPPQRAG